jgi:7 transmembrane helices usually fused to an inactive transglutaminase
MECGRPAQIRGEREHPVASKSTVTAKSDTTGIGWIVAALCVVPLVLILYKQSNFAGAELIRRLFSLTDFASDSSRVSYVLFVPIGAVLIVFLRTVMGIRVLGPFRSILLALAFQMTGVLVGTLFLAITILVIAGLRPLLDTLRLGNYARVSTILSAVSLMIFATFIIGNWYGIDSLQQAVHFPIVVLCLTGDGFVNTLRREGTLSALWRGGMTAAAAILLTVLASVDSITNMLLAYPELTFIEIALLILMSKYFSYRLFEKWNPPPKARRLKNQQSADSESDRDFEEQLAEL